MALTKRRLAAWLGGLALALAGCSDHGPVGLFSNVLFNRTIPLPSLQVSSTTPNYSTGPATSDSPPRYKIIVNIRNLGGSSTYGTVVGTFTAPTDPNVQLYTGANASSGVTTTVQAAYGSTGSEISPAGGTEYPGQNCAVDANGNVIIYDTTYSIAFSDTSGLAANFHVVFTDPLGNIWNQNFSVPH